MQQNSAFEIGDLVRLKSTIRCPFLLVAEFVNGWPTLKWACGIVTLPQDPSAWVKVTDQDFVTGKEPLGHDHAKLDSNCTCFRCCSPLEMLAAVGI